MKRSSFKFFILKKKIYGMPVNWAWSFEQTLNGSQLGFTIGTILAIFYLRVTQMLLTKNRFSRWLPWQVTQMLPTKFGVNWPFGSGEEAKNRFSRWLPWRPSWISDRHDFSYFWSISHPNASYQVWSLLGLGVEAKNRFSRWRPWWPSWISDRHDFSYFWSTSHPDASYQVSSQLA